MSKALEFMETLVGPVTVGMLLRSYRTGHELSLKELAKKLNVTIGYISNIETGKTSLSLAKALEICRTLEHNERFWMTIYFEEEARKAGASVKVTVTQTKKRKAI